MSSVFSLFTSPSSVISELFSLSIHNSVLFGIYILLSLLLLTSILTRLRNLPLFQRLALHALRQYGSIPSHIAFIMDGNRRWARRGGLESHEGHPQGGEKLIESLQWCLEAGVRHVTVYAFSIENFKRSAREVDEIFKLALRKFQDLTDRQSVVHEKRVRVRILGDLTMIPKDLRSVMARIMEQTKEYTDGPTLNICFAYTARHDMASAVCDLAKMVRDGSVRKDQITEEAIGACLSTGYAKGAERNAPYPQLLVRTSGETRLSDFLLWEAEDSVLAFYPVLWPDLTKWDFVQLLLKYQAQYRGRGKALERRGISEEDRGKKLVGESGDEWKAVNRQLITVRERFFLAISGYRKELQEGSSAKQ